MNKKNKIFLGLFFSFVVLSSIGFVEAATTLNTPSASATVNGATVFNVTFTDFVFGTDDLINLTFYAKSALTANSAWTVIGTNNSLNGTLHVNESITTIDLSGILEDANDYIFNVTSTNSTGGTVLSYDTNTGITIDQTVPQEPSSLSPSAGSTDTDGSVTFSGTVTGANTTSCTLQFDGILPPGGNGQAMTHTGNTCSLTLSSVPSQTFTWFIRASDETNTTDSSAQQVNVKINTGGGGGTLPVCGNGVCEFGETQGQNQECLSDCPVGQVPASSGNKVLVILAVLGIIAFLIIKKK